MKDTLSNILLLPFRLVQGIATRDFSKAGRILVSWSPIIFSVNDHTAFSLRRFSFGRFGYWGYCPRFDGGANFGAGYAFLPNYLIWKFGSSGYLLLSLFLYLLFFYLLTQHTGIETPWTLCATGLLALNSPFFKNSTFVCGRHDIPGWALLLSGFLLLLRGFEASAFLFFTIAFMAHPSVSVVGTVYLLMFLLTGRLSVLAVGLFIAAQIINLFWYIPYLKTYWKKVKGHQWTAPGQDPTRAISVYQKKFIGMSVFILSLSVFNANLESYIFAGVPFGLFLLNCWKDSVVNRFSIELLWLCGAATALAYTGSPWLGIPYLFSLYFYASPAPRFSFPFKPLLIDKSKYYDAFNPIYKKVNDTARMAYISFPENADMYRMDAQLLTLVIRGVCMRQKTIEILGLRYSPNDGSALSTTYLSKIANQYAVSYFITPSVYSKYITPNQEFEIAARCEPFAAGSVPGMELIIYKANQHHPRILPEGSITEHVSGGFCIKCKPGRHEIKYQALNGLRVYQDDRELVIENVGDRRFFINSQTDSEVLIQHEVKRLWLPNRILNSQIMRPKSLMESIK